MLKKLLATPNEWQWTVLRLAAGIMILPHGMQKTLGTFGGAGALSLDRAIAKS